MKITSTAVVNVLPAEMAPDRRPFPPANEMRPLYNTRNNYISLAENIIPDYHSPDFCTVWRDKEYKQSTRRGSTLT